jgi:hypothetical protein
LALELTPLTQLPPAVERAAGAATPPVMRLMAARGMAPLPPPDMAVALYQLSFSDNPLEREAAIKSAAELPDPILVAALAAPLDVRVLDFFARRVTQRKKLLEIVLFNKATHDETFRHLATVLGEVDLEIIAKNEERLLRAPQIIAALYMNPKTRMSTAQRAIELAVRNNVRVDGIPAFDEAAEALAEGDAADEHADEAFRVATTVAVDADAALKIVPLDLEAEPPIDLEGDAPPAEDEGEGVDAEVAEALEAEQEAGSDSEEKAKKLTELSPSAKIRVATLGNAFSRSVLIRDKNRQVFMACVRSPGVSDSEALRYASNRALDEDVVRYISNQRQWLRVPAIRLALCNNPKTPVPTTMRLLPQLSVRDLKIMSRSKGIPSAIAKAAKQILQSRGA